MSRDMRCAEITARQISFFFAPEMRKENGWCGRRRSRTRPPNIFATVRDATSNFWEAGRRRNRSWVLGKLIYRLAYLACKSAGPSQLGRWILEGISTITWKAIVSYLETPRRREATFRTIYSQPRVCSAPQQFPLPCVLFSTHEAMALGKLRLNHLRAN